MWLNATIPLANTRVISTQTCKSPCKRRTDPNAVRELRGRAEGHRLIAEALPEIRGQLRTGEESDPSRRRSLGPHSAGIRRQTAESHRDGVQSPLYERREVRNRPSLGAHLGNKPNPI